MQLSQASAGRFAGASPAEVIIGPFDGAITDSEGR